MVEGMPPVRLLSYKYRYSRPVSFPISEGMVPVRLYPPQEIEVTVASSPIQVGSVLPLYASQEPDIVHANADGNDVGVAVGNIVGIADGEAVGVDGALEGLNVGYSTQLLKDES